MILNEEGKETSENAKILLAFKSPIVHTQVLKGALGMVAPDVEVHGKGQILISSEEGETSGNADKTLASFNVKDGAILECDDFQQDYNLKLFIVHS